VQEDVSSLQLIEFFEQRRVAGTPMVMVTVIETSGSTYAKAGHRMLIDDQNLYYGLVSGGCLEGDLVEHAKRVFREGQARIVTYDLREDKDELWGLNIGCNGLTRLLLQLVTAENDYQPMRSIANVWQRRVSETIICITASTHPQLPIGRRASKRLTLTRRAPVAPWTVLTRSCRCSRTCAAWDPESPAYRG
jgi:xanthine/CO dehydrogenase XdhC/CoxF family maturation factor